MKPGTIGICASAMIVLVFALTACKDEKPVPSRAGEAETSATADAIEAPADIAPQDRWLGKWTGPEATFLTLAKAGSGYAITIQNLDGPTNYDGHAVGDRIAFERGGKMESIKATDGQATGMKWLADKKDCLTVAPGEGYCRD